MPVGAPKTVWTAEFTSDVQESLDARLDDYFVAWAHGLTMNALRCAIYDGLVSRPKLRVRTHDAENVVELVPRTCLCCGKAFKAETRFIRSCDTCRDKGSVLGDWAEGIV